MDQNVEKRCQICGKFSNGMHFGAITCRACAAFFRRAIVLKLDYQCKNGPEMCDLDGKSRNMCRYCRFEKCKQVGMDSEKVVLDYDPTTSQKGGGPSELEVKVEKHLTYNETFENLKIQLENAKKVIYSETSENAENHNAGKIKLKIDFSELIEILDDIFENPNSNKFVEKSEEILENPKNDLESLTEGVANFRKGVWPKSDIRFLGKGKLTHVVAWLNARIRKNALWFSKAKFLMENLEKSQKLQVFKTSWNTLRQFERIAMTVKHYGQEALDQNILLVSDDTAMTIDKSLVHFEEISDLSDNYFNQLFHPFLNKYMQEVAKPMLELNLTTEEVVFCLVHCLGVDVTGWTSETIETVQKFKELVSDQMHFYYSNFTDHKMYSLRIMKLMKLVKSTKKISREKSRIKDLVWLFDIFKADVSEPRFFELF